MEILAGMPGMPLKLIRALVARQPDRAGRSPSGAEKRLT